MEKELEQETHNTPDETLTEEQLSELKHRAEVSSQNYEIRKKMEKENAALKEKLDQLENQLGSDDYDTPDEERKLKKEIDSLRETVNALNEKNQQSEVEAIYNKYPVLKGKLEEFDSFKEQNKGMSLETAAKAFVIENDLLEQPKKRGLEPARGGVKTVPSPGKMSVEDVKRLRENNYLEYKRLNDEGKIRI